MTRQEMSALAAQAVAQGRVTRVPQGRRCTSERTMYLLTEASDRERDEARIEQELRAREGRKS